MDRSDVSILRAHPARQKDLGFRRAGPVQTRFQVCWVPWVSMSLFKKPGQGGALCLRRAEW